MGGYGYSYSQLLGVILINALLLSHLSYAEAEAEALPVLQKRALYGFRTVPDRASRIAPPPPPLPNLPDPPPNSLLHP